MEHSPHDRNLTASEITEEVLRRARVLKRKRAHRRMLTSISCGICAIVVALLVTYQAEAPAKLKESPYIATIYDDANLGGYILVGIAMFAIGVAVTFLCMKHANRKR